MHFACRSPTNSHKFLVDTVSFFYESVSSRYSSQSSQSDVVVASRYSFTTIILVLKEVVSTYAASS